MYPGGLRTNPVCLASEGTVSIEMEKSLAAMPDNQNVKAEKILEVNADHDIFTALKGAFENDSEKFNLYTNLLYNQALLIEGLPVTNPVEYTNSVCQLMK